MKGECERCGQIAELALSPALGGMNVTCAACGETYFVEVSKAVPPEVIVELTPPPAAPSVGGSECPKCGSPIGGTAVACARCGLAVSQWERWRAEAAAQAAADPEMDELWNAAQGKWSDPARHDAFLEHCRKAGEFALPARRYRKVLAERPGDAVAEARLKQVLFLAEQALNATAMPRERAKSSPVTVVILCILIGVVAVGGWIVFQKMMAR